MAAFALDPALCRLGRPVSADTLRTLASGVGGGVMSPVKLAMPAFDVAPIASVAAVAAGSNDSAVVAIPAAFNDDAALAAVTSTALVAAGKPKSIAVTPLAIASAAPA